MMRTLVMIALAAALLSASFAAGGVPEGLGRKEAEALRLLERRSGGALEVQWHDQANTPAVLRGALTRPSAHTPEWVVFGFLESVKPLYGLNRPREQMQVTDVVKSKDGSAEVRLRRMLYGVPVWGDTLNVRVDRDGVIREVRGRMHPHLERHTFRLRKHAKVTERQALAAAMAAAEARGLVYDAVEVEHYYLPTEPGTPLVYAVQFKREREGGAGGRAEAAAGEQAHERTVVFIHALTGRTIEN